MVSIIPVGFKDLLEVPVTVSVTTMLPNGQPQSTPVWCDFDGTHVLVNSAVGRRKDKNVRLNPKVSVLAIDPTDDRRWMEIRGEVEEITEDGAVDHINKLSKLYRGVDEYFGNVAPESARTTMIRVIYKIKPLKVTTST
jgi:PPOX class probable F420-dependent enzyme